MFKVRPLEVPEHCQQKLICGGMQLGFVWKKKMCLFIARSAIWFLVHDDEPRCHPQWWCNSRSYHLYGCTTPTDYRTCIGSCTYALLSDVCAPTLWNTRMSCTKEQAVPSMMPGCNAIYSSITFTSAALNNGSTLFLLLISGWCLQLSRTLGIHYICQTIFEHICPIIQTSEWQCVVSILSS